MFKKHNHIPLKYPLLIGGAKVPLQTLLKLYDIDASLHHKVLSANLSRVSLGDARYIYDNETLIILV